MRMSRAPVLFPPPLISARNLDIHFPRFVVHLWWLSHAPANPNVILSCNKRSWVESAMRVFTSRKLQISETFSFHSHKESSSFDSSYSACETWGGRSAMLTGGVNQRPQDCLNSLLLGLSLMSYVEEDFQMETSL